ncbi:MAG: glycosyltransferase, partial [Thermoplasmata archaeon]
FVHPSLRIEGLPTVVAEAMATGVPVIATDSGGTETGIVDGRTGILVPKGKIERVTAAIETLVTDSSLAARLAAAGRERAQKRFAWPEIVDRLLADLASVGSSR